MIKNAGSKSYINLAEEFINQENQSLGAQHEPCKKGFGRGLSALFGDIDNKSISSDKVSNTVPIADLSRNKYQPRTIFDEEKLSELSKSIKENGVIQPIAVRPNKYEKGKYEIVAGERRWLVAQRQD